MTCVIGLIDGSDIYIGADSAVVTITTFNISTRRDRKVFFVGKNHEYLIGYAGVVRPGQLLQSAFNAPEWDGQQDIADFMRVEFINSIRDCLTEGGAAKTSDDGREVGGDFLIGFQGRLFYISEDYQVEEVMQNYKCIGCAADFAVGVLAATTSDPPKRRIIKALHVAYRHNAAVRPPFYVLCLEGGANG